MKRLLAVYRVWFATTFAVQLQYRVSLMIWLIGLVLEPVIYLVVWSTVARSNGGSVASFTASDFAAYFILMMLVNHATFTWIIYGFDQRIRMGAFSPMLLRPIHPIHLDIADNLTYKALTSTVVVPTAVALALIFHPRLHSSPWMIPAFLLSLVLAIGLRFLVEWTVALVAFWTTRMAAIDQMYFVSVLFLSGQVAPLSLFPPPIRLVATILPFRWMVAFPVELLLGRLSTTDVLAGLVTQVGWIIVSFGLFRVVWKTGVQRYSAVGT